jgi:hypothetical protein
MRSHELWCGFYVYLQSDWFSDLHKELFIEATML